MRFPISYNGEEVMVDVTSWESAIDNRIEFYAVLARQQETFVNFVKRTDQSIIAEVSSSADLSADIKTAIKNKLIHLTKHPE